MKRALCLILALGLLLTGCAGNQSRELRKFEATFLGLFDTVTTVVGYRESQEQFEAEARAIRDGLEEYHRLFDVYNEYEGLNNLKTVNDHAGIAPVEVDSRIIDLLKDCRYYYGLTGGRVNVALGSVLYLWHTARNDSLDDPAHAYIPDGEALRAAAEHTDLTGVVIDEAASTVYISDPEVRLDVGAVAKGWAAQRVAETAPEGLLISVGGNVCGTGPKTPEGNPWVVGVQNPDGGDSFLHTLYLTRGCMVTSGDYQRVYWVNGQMYHHIIDPDTLHPSAYWRSVTVCCGDSGLADALSTALFLLPLAEGQALLETCGAEAMWVDSTGKIYYSSGFEALIRT